MKHIPKIRSIVVGACVAAAGCLSAFAEGHTHTDADGDTVIFDPIDSYDALTNLFATGGSGYLTEDITADRGLSVAADVNLCLNDKMLDLDGKGHIEIKSGKSFALYDCGTTVRYWEADDNGLWIPADATDKTTVGGVITGGNNVNGGAIYNKGTFTMYGGNICGNSVVSSDSYGGGVYVDNGTFTMNGGAICGNLAMRAGSTLTNGGAYGGGVYIVGSIFTMKDGTISGNKATYGGGVLSRASNTAKDSKMTIEGGTISDNSADKAGGGVNIRAGECTIKNVTICGNRAETHGGGVYVTCESKKSVVTYLTMENVKICDNVAALYGGGVYASGSGAKGSDVTVTDATISGNMAGAGGGIQVHAAATLHLVADADKTVSIVGNTATTADGGIANWGELHLSGNVVVKDNVCTATDDDGINRPVNMSTETPICIDGDLTGSEICIAHAGPVTNEVVTVGSVTNVYITAVHDTGVLTDGYSKHDADVFVYDGSFRMIRNADGELEVSMGSEKNPWKIGAGDNPESVTAWMNDDAEVVIEGEGEMKNFTEADPAPWGAAIESAEIGEGVTRIDVNAFKDCASLKHVTVLATVPPSLDEAAFAGCGNLNRIYVPKGTVATYKSAPGWIAYEEKIGEIQRPGILFPYGDGGAFVPSAKGTVTFQGAVIAADGVAGAITLKMTKPNKRTGLFNLTAAVKMADGKRFSFKAKKVAAPAEGPLEMALEGSNKKSKEHKLTVVLEGNSFNGAFDGAQIDGASDAFKNKKSDRAAAIMPFVKTWTGAFLSDSTAMFFSAKLSKTGKATVKVVLPDGKTVGCSSKAEVGDLDYGVIAVPVTVKRSAMGVVTTLGFRLAFARGEDGKLACQIVDVSPLRTVVKKTGAVIESTAMQPFEVSELTVTSKEFKTFAVNLPESLTAKYGKPTKVSLRMASTGVVSGLIKFGKVSARASGVVIGGTGVGIMTIKRDKVTEIFLVAPAK